MNDQLDLKQTEQASFKLAAYADGTSDITLGSMFILLGCYAWTREAFGAALNMVFFLAFLAAITISMGILRKRLVPERIGVVKFGPQVKKRQLVFLLITILLAAGMIATWVLSARGWSPIFPTWVRSWGFEIIVALIVLGIFGAIAYTMNIQRYYLYGVLLAATFMVQIIPPTYEGLPFLAAGAIITIIGIVLLYRFLKAYPVQEEEASNG